MTPHPHLDAFAAATTEQASQGFWLAAQMARRVNAAPAHAQLALQTLAVIAATRADRLGDRAAQHFKRHTGREVVRPDGAAPPR